jgi:hypothetical protein
MGLLARFFKGGLSIPAMLTMTWPEIVTWFDIYELQSTEEEVISDLSYDKKTGKKKTLPHPKRIREIVLEKIKERKEKYNVQ